MALAEASEALSKRTNRGNVELADELNARPTVGASLQELKG